MTKQEYMQLALELAKKGMGHTSPNPMVGCVVVKDGKVVTEGFHERYGEYHAERNALTRYDGDLTGADLYVTLEPCCHHGNTPPCTDIIIEKGIGRVFVGSMDPNPKVAGKGAAILKEHGITVETGILEKECNELNEVFFHYITTGLPYVVMKYAMTLDGKIATATGDSKWITGEEARSHVHMLRKKYSAIMVGIGTVLADDPMLNCRLEEGVDPVRIICDSGLRIPPDSRIVKTAGEIPTIVAYVVGDSEKERKLKEAGIELIQTSGQNTVDLPELMKELGRRKIDSVLIEGGGTLHGTMLKSGLVSRVYCYVAPKLIGGKEAKSPVEGAGFSLMNEALKIEETEIVEFGNDVCISGRVAPQSI
ncbi:MAG: bifunctional diaminohydroxyphosphoribosylaminopyrimidine deaminase/5-amino-6-(5-phosphoribosylamino)uracil reductase RibD [Lachnospiraceae bacterium]|nr:bifunctional diaminohydroxyphosphoribosylaminopyrimidine deaminase/5-amino-6-(5-phosphoribosylamino)uracil reductase RibD [Lachnospiraceae bacterium]